ncbi:MAG: ABC transporter permease [Chloroflexota bacterium]|nr:ABC transporter permease [Chloroflexota bacterium]
MFKSILNLAWKEILQLLRDRVLLLFLILIPVTLLSLIAESTGGGIRGIKYAVWDQERSALSQQLLTAIDNTSAFNLAFRANSYAEVQRLMDDGEIGAALIIPPTFTRDALRPGSSATLDVIVDGTNEVVASNVIGTLQGVVGDLTLGDLAAQGGRLPGGIDLKIEVAFNPTLNIRWSTLTGQFALITYLVVLVVAAVSFVRERELGTMEQLVVTPITRLELLFGKGLMGVIIGLFNLLVLYLALHEIFQIPMHGSLALLLALGMLFVITEIGAGMLISLVTNSQQQAILVVFLLSMLEITFSGYLVPTENMPIFMQLFAAVSPLQHFTAISRAIFLKGSTFTMLLGHVVPLVLLTTGSIGAAWVLFAKAAD